NPSENPVLATYNASLQPDQEAHPMKVVVVGASSGLGRCIGVGLAQRGAQVALLARRRENLEVAAKEAGNGALAIACDVTDEESVRAALEQAATGLGGIDGLVYSSGVGALTKL